MYKTWKSYVDNENSKWAAGYFAYLVNVAGEEIKLNGHAAVEAAVA
jgi:hypothetical protein